MADRPLIVHSDSLTIVNQFADLQQHDRIQLEWTHAQWWGFLLTLIHRRRYLCATPLQLAWCPAHLLEHLSIAEITPQQAQDAGSTVQDIWLIRKADQVAKNVIDQAANKIKCELRVKEVDVYARQLWLSKLNRACKKPEVTASPAPAATTAPAARLTPRQLCPRWAWDNQQEDYTWHTDLDLMTKGPEKPPLSSTNFQTFLQFMSSCHWRFGDGLACSVFELAVAAFVHGCRFDLPAGTLCTPHAYATIIRAGISFCKLKQVVVAPLLLDKGNKSNGKTFPKGAFIGAEVLFNPTLEVLCRAFERGAKATPHSWSMLFDSLL